MTDSRTDIKRHVNRGVAWIGMASTAVGLLDIAALAIVLRFWVKPEDYGIATLATSLFPVLDLATDMGLTSAVIQRDDHTTARISTVFWLNLFMSILLFALLFLGAPLLGAFHKEPIIGTMLIAYGTKLVFQNSYAIPMNMMKRELRFKELSVIRIIANVAEFFGKIGFAAAGYEIWCFVLGPMCRVFITAVGVQLRHPWRPTLHFRPSEAAQYVRFGLKTSASQILFYFYTNIDYQIVGAYFGKMMLGFYRLAYELVLEPVRIISHVVVEIAFPVFSRLRAKRAQLVEQFISFTRQNLVAVLPFVAIVFLESSEMLRLFWGDDYESAADAARVLCFVGVLRSLSFVVPPLLDGMGYPGVTLLYTAVASVVLPTLFVLFAHFLGGRHDYVSVAYAWALGYPIAFAVLAMLALRRIGMSAIEYLRRVIGIPLCAAIAMGAGWLTSLAVGGLRPSFRVVLVATVFLGALALLLAYFQGISPRSIAASLRNKPPTGPPPEEPTEGPPSIA